VAATENKTISNKMLTRTRCHLKKEQIIQVIIMIKFTILYSCNCFYTLTIYVI